MVTGTTSRMTQLKLRNTRPDPDVVAEIAMERRADHGADSHFKQQFAKEYPSFRGRCRKRSVITDHPHFRGGLIRLDFKSAGGVQVPPPHFFFLRAHAID